MNGFFSAIAGSNAVSFFFVFHLSLPFTSVSIFDFARLLTEYLRCFELSLSTSGYFTVSCDLHDLRKLPRPIHIWASAISF